MMDPRNQIALAAIWGALGNGKEDGYYPATTANIDFTSLLLSEEVEAAYTTSNADRKLAVEARSVAVVKTGRKGRGISMGHVTVASGQHVCAIALIKDSCFKKTDIFQV